MCDAIYCEKGNYTKDNYFNTRNNKWQWIKIFTLMV